MKFDPKELNEKGGPKFAAQPLERKVFTHPRTSYKKAPNYDLLRAIQVGDSAPDPEKRLDLVNVQVTGKNTGPPIEIEAIRENVTFTATLTLDGYLLNDDVQRQLGWDEAQGKSILQLPHIINHWTRQRLADDAKRKRTGRWRGFFEGLTKIYTEGRLADNEFVLQLGWGGGWDSKTLGNHLTEDERAFAAVVRRYQKQMDRQRSFRQGDRYPKSRRVVVDAGGRPIMSLGWVKIKMECT